MHATRTRTMLVLGIDCVRLNDSADVRRTIFTLKRDRRQAANGRLPCAIRLCVARRVSIVRDDVARRHDPANTENARDSWSTRAMVIHLKASETVGHGVATDVANDAAQSDPRDRLAVLFEKVREFLPESAALVLVIPSFFGVARCAQLMDAHGRVAQ
jgi:hypothetical protein